MKEQFDKYDAWDFHDEAKEAFYDWIEKECIKFEHNVVVKDDLIQINDYQNVKKSIDNIFKDSRSWDFESWDGYTYSYNFYDNAEDYIWEKFGDAMEKLGY